MEPMMILGPLTIVAIVALIARTTIRIAQLRSSHAEPNEELLGRVEELEGTVRGVQQELAETQERLDFAERLLSKGAKP
jgi:hypothetical protein